MTRRSLIVVSTVVITLLVLGLALWGVSRIWNLDFAIGEVVVRSQRGATYPLPVDHDPPPAVRPERPPAGEASGVRNVVLLIGDGLGIGALSSGSALIHGAGGGLAVERAPVVGLVRTWATDDLTTGSAASATAMATGFKVRRKAVSVLDDGRIPVTLVEAARNNGLATGLITTSGLADATTAAFVAHVHHRDSYEVILRQILASETEVLIGGDWTRKGKALRNSDYMAVLAQVDTLAAGRFNLLRDADELDAAEAPLLALFPPRTGSDRAHGPPLAVSTSRALELLAATGQGFVLVVESEETDESAHDTDIEALVAGLRELDEAVAVAVDFAAEHGDTLVLVTADHDTGGLSIVRGRYEKGIAKLRWASSEHTAQWVPLFAFGPGSERFSGVLDNTQIGRRVGDLLDLDGFPSAELGEVD